MNDRDVLIFTLAAVARRLRLNALLGELAWMACAISGALVLYQILVAAISAPAVASALQTLLILLLIGVVVVFAVRGLRPITLDEVAATADAQADLKDELKSGYCFARQAEASPLVDLQIRRAVLTVQRIDSRELFPIAIPRGAFAALALIFAASLLPWIAPQFGHPQSTSTDSIATEVAATAGKARQLQPLSNPLPAAGRVALEIPDGTQMPGARGSDAAWARLEAAVHALADGEELKDLAEAMEHRDTARTVQLLEEFERRREYARAQAGGRPPADTVHASPDLIARLQKLFSPGGNVPQSALDAVAEDDVVHALDLAQRLDDMRASGANNPAAHTLDEGTNPLQAAVPLERFGPREARRSQGQGGEFAGTTDVEGGAMGRRVTQSNLGAGGKPSANETSNSNNIEAEQVLGARTMRLAVQLKQVKIEGNNPREGDAQGVAEAAYAATRAQQAQLGYQNAPQHAGYVTESALSGDRIPLAYRGAVKEYFLALDRNQK